MHCTLLLTTNFDKNMTWNETPYYCYHVWWLLEREIKRKNEQGTIPGAFLWILQTLS